MRLIWFPVRTGFLLRATKTSPSGGAAVPRSPGERVPRCLAVPVAHSQFDHDAVAVGDDKLRWRRPVGSPLHKYSANFPRGIDQKRLQLHWSLRHFKLNCKGVVTSFCAPHLPHFVTPAKRTRTRLAPHCQWGGRLIALMKFCRVRRCFGDCVFEFLNLKALRMPMTTSVLRTSCSAFRMCNLTLEMPSNH